jgi:hypothetical protein
MLSTAAQRLNRKLRVLATGFVRSGDGPAGDAEV